MRACEELEALEMETGDDELRRLVEEQAALRRVATLVARAAPPAEVFDAVCAEFARLGDAPFTRLFRHEPDGTTVVVGARGGLGHQVHLSVGRRLRTDRKGVLATVLRLEPGLGAAAAAPIVVNGRLWGAMAAGWTASERPAAGTEERLTRFTELVAAAITNADSRVELAAARTRIIASADETRRRIERRLHEGTQQRLVSLALDLRVAEASAPGELVELRAQLSRTASELAAAVDDLGQIVRGIHPAMLVQGGLSAALKALGRRSSVPVELDLSVERRLPDPVQVAVYYVVSEALGNAARHAHASVVRVRLDEHDATLRLSVADDGVGGAELGPGSGLIDLRDRIEALGGRIEIASPSGEGTTLHVELPAAP
jgi:signal transduction histidine kinase